MATHVVCNELNLRTVVLKRLPKLEGLNHRYALVRQGADDQRYGLFRLYWFRAPAHIEIDQRWWHSVHRDLL